MSHPKHRAQRSEEAPSGVGDDEQTRKDMAYSPASERETQTLQDQPVEESAAMDGVDRELVSTLPGTGGPDDSGDTAVAPSEARAQDIDITQSEGPMLEEGEDLDTGAGLHRPRP